MSAALTACADRIGQGPELITIGALSDHTQQKDYSKEREATLNVVATGFTLALAASQVSAGTVTFSVKNAGTIPHNFAVGGNGVDRKTAIIKPGDTAVFTVDLRPGTYTYKCTVHLHDLLGMKGTLTVSGS